MQKETAFSHTESLELIQRMINQAKNRWCENGHLYLVWGWAVFICSIAQFVLAEWVHYEQHYLVWLLCAAVGIYQPYYLMRRGRKRQVQTYADRIVGYVWLAFVISLCLSGFYFGMLLGDWYYKIVGPAYLVLYGIPTFLSGIILQFRPLIIGGIGCWVMTLGAAFTKGYYQLLFLSAAMLIAWILPGYQLRARFKKSNY